MSSKPAWSLLVWVRAQCGIRCSSDLSSSSAPGRGTIFASRTSRGISCRGGMPCFTMSLCAASHQGTPSMLASVVQSSSGAKSFRKSLLSRREPPTRSWHCSESPVVIVASKSVITITSFAVRAAIAARFFCQWKGAEGDQSQKSRRARHIRKALTAAATPRKPNSSSDAACVLMPSRDAWYSYTTLTGGRPPYWDERVLGERDRGPGRI